MFATRRTSSSPRRRRATSLLAVGAMAASLLGVAATTPAHAATASLKSLAQADGIYFGTALTQSNLSNSALTAVANAQFDMVTPGNEMKWDTTEPSNGSFNFGPGDAIVSYAKAHGMQVRGHNLVWQNQLPSWVSSLPSNQVQSAMETHITTEVTHYKGEVYSWDVINEPFDDSGNLRQDVFYNAMGTGYIADALRTAHAADPNAKLYINDYNIEGENAKSDAMYNLAKSLLAEGAPLNGIGFESHFILGQVPSSMKANMQRFADLGLDVAVTELDDRIQLPATSADLTQQASDFSTVVKDCLGVSACVGVSQWGVGDADSWIPGTFSGYGAATMFDNNYQPKPAFDAVVQALGGGTTGGDTQAPSAPTGLTVTGTTSSTASLSWSASTDNVGVAGYDVYRNGTQVGTSNGTTYTDTGLSASTAYQYTVKAYDAAGNVSAASSAVTATTASSGGGTPPPSSGCTASLHVDNAWNSGFTATVTVTAGSSAIKGWKVSWSWPGGQTITNAWNATISGSSSAPTATNMSYNGSVAASGSTTFGFQGSGTAPTSAPTLSCTAS